MSGFTAEHRAKALATRLENKRLREAGQLPEKKPNGKTPVEHARQAVLQRWESVQQEQEAWLKPFHELEIERAMRYLEDLRVITSKAGEIMNRRINEGKNIKCSGPRCGKDLTGLKSNGLPKWISKKDFKDVKNPEIWHCLYFCSEICNNEWVRSQMGGGGTDGK